MVNNIYRRNTKVWHKITLHTVQTDAGEGANAKDGEGASKSDHDMRKTSPIHQPTKHTTQGTTNTGFWKGRGLDVVPVPL